MVDDLGDLEREVCACGYSYVVLSIGSFEPIFSQHGELIELPTRRKLSRAA